LGLKGAPGRNATREHGSPTSIRRFIGVFSTFGGTALAGVSSEMLKRLGVASDRIGLELVTVSCVVVFLLVFAASMWLVFWTAGNHDQGWPADTLRGPLSRSSSGWDQLNR
jgi:hypothetical protein